VAGHPFAPGNDACLESVCSPHGAKAECGVGTLIPLQAFVERPPPDEIQDFIRATGCHLCARRHQWVGNGNDHISDGISNDIYEIFVIYVSSVADTTQH